MRRHLAALALMASFLVALYAGAQVAQPAAQDLAFSAYLPAALNKWEEQGSVATATPGAGSTTTPGPGASATPTTGNAPLIPHDLGGKEACSMCHSVGGTGVGVPGGTGLPTSHQGRDDTTCRGCHGVAVSPTVAPCCTVTPTATPGTAATATPTVGAVATPVPGQVLNGDFEQGRGVGWAEWNSLNAYPLVRRGDSLTPPVVPHSGAWLGGLFSMDNRMTSQIGQRLTLGATAQNYLRFWWYVDSEELCDVFFYDFMTVYINGKQEINLQICRSSNTGGWAPTHIDLTKRGYNPGQTVDIVFESSALSDGGSTKIYLDDFTLSDVLN